jgi:fused signal recognition particle receptor
MEWTEEDPQAEPAEGGHDDIMKRLLEYQRSLRGGASPEEAAEAMTRGVGDPALLEASEAAASLADLLSTEVVPGEEGVLEAEPATEPEVAESEVAEPELEAIEEPGADMEAAEEPVVEASEVAEALEALGESRSELEGRVGALEGKLEGLAAKIAELRRSFQDMAIAADERLASIADEVEQARRDSEES